MTAKKPQACKFCSHGMESEQSHQVYCLANGPTPVQTERGIVGALPAMMKWGKCDRFAEGENKKMVTPPPLPIRPRGEEATWKKQDRVKFAFDTKTYMDFMDKWA